MPRRLEPEPLDLADVFRKAQEKMKGDLGLDRVFAHAPTTGAASEQQWLALLEAYLPKRYRAAPAFIVNAAGKCSWQIDVAIYDNLRSPPLFPHASGIHLPIESVYAVLEVKTVVSRDALRGIGKRLDSVRTLRTGRRARPILTGVLSTTSIWTPETFEANLRHAFEGCPAKEDIDLGCVLEQGAFERGRTMAVSSRQEALIFFVMRLVERLNKLGPAPAVDLMRYVKGLGSFQQWTSER